MPKTSQSRPTTSSKSGDSTEDLVIKAKVGDRSAENEIVRRNLPRLRRFAHGRLPSRLRNGFDTEDIVQDSLLKALQRIASFDTSRPGGLQAYLRVAIQNRVRDAYRRGEFPIGSSEELAEVTDKAPSPFDRAREKEVAELNRRPSAACAPPIELCSWPSSRWVTTTNNWRGRLVNRRQTRRGLRFAAP